MTGMDRRVSEREFHDRQAAERSARFRAAQESLIFLDEDFLDHETWIRPAFNQFGSCVGKRALDYGCGHGMAAVVLARAGATVTGFDLSPGYVAEARQRAAANRVNVECAVADGEELPFPTACFDLVWGNAILHHLDLTRAGRELDRVLKPGGIAVFCEPWGGNPLLSIARNRLPYPGKERTPDEQPLTHRDLLPLRKIFANIEVRGFQLLGMLRRVWKNKRVCHRLDLLDTRILSTCPSLQNWCRYAVITIRKET